MKHLLSLILATFLFLSFQLNNANAQNCVGQGQWCLDSGGNNLGTCCAGLACNQSDPYGSGYVTCGPIRTPAPTAAPGTCPASCVPVSSCINVVPGYYGSCPKNQECCSGSLGGADTAYDVLCTASGGKQGINTAIGCIPYEDHGALIVFIVRWAIGIAGGIALVLILLAGFQITTSAGDPKRLQAGQELLTSAIAGLLLLVFSTFVLRIIGVNILGIF